MGRKLVEKRRKDRHGRIKKVLSFLLAVSMVLGNCLVSAAASEWPSSQENIILSFEDDLSGLSKNVEYGTAKENLSFPEKLRVSLKLEVNEEKPLEYVQQVPSPEVLETYGYQAPENEAEVRETGGIVIYSVHNTAGTTTAYRVYGTIKNAEKESTSKFFSCDANGNVTGIIGEVPVTWNCESYQQEEAGTYTFTPVLPEGVQAEVDLPGIFITVDEKAVEEQEPVTIISFSDVEKTINVAAGTTEEEIGLPSELTGRTDREEEVQIPVTWRCENGYKQDQAGEYLFKAAWDASKYQYEGESISVKVTVETKSDVTSHTLTRLPVLGNLALSYPIVLINETSGVQIPKNSFSEAMETIGYDGSNDYTIVFTKDQDINDVEAGLSTYGAYANITLTSKYIYNNEEKGPYTVDFMQGIMRPAPSSNTYIKFIDITLDSNQMVFTPGRKLIMDTGVNMTEGCAWSIFGNSMKGSGHVDKGGMNVTIRSGSYETVRVNSYFDRDSALEGGVNITIDDNVMIKGIVSAGCIPSVKGDVNITVGDNVSLGGLTGSFSTRSYLDGDVNITVGDNVTVGGSFCGVGGKVTSGHNVKMVVGDNFTCPTVDISGRGSGMFGTINEEQVGNTSIIIGDGAKIRGVDGVKDYTDVKGDVKIEIGKNVSAKQIVAGGEDCVLTGNASITVKDGGKVDSITGGFESVSGTADITVGTTASGQTIQYVNGYGGKGASSAITLSGTKVDWVAGTSGGDQDTANRNITIKANNGSIVNNIFGAGSTQFTGGNIAIVVDGSTASCVYGGCSGKGSFTGNTDIKICNSSKVSDSVNGGNDIAEPRISFRGDTRILVTSGSTVGTVNGRGRDNCIGTCNQYITIEDDAKIGNDVLGNDSVTGLSGICHISVDHATVGGHVRIGMLDSRYKCLGGEINISNSNIKRNIWATNIIEDGKMTCKISNSTIEENVFINNNDTSTEKGMELNNSTIGKLLAITDKSGNPLVMTGTNHIGGTRDGGMSIYGNLLLAGKLFFDGRGDIKVTGNIEVDREGAEIGIYRTETATYPINVGGNMIMPELYPIKMSVIGSAAKVGDVLFKYAEEDNARPDEYITSIEGMSIKKDGKNIVLGQSVTADDLEISNTVVGKYGDKTKNFDITVQMVKMDSNGSVTEKLTGDITCTGSSIVSGVEAPDIMKVTFTDGKAVISLKHGQKLILKDLPIGYTYNVDQSGYNGYTTTSKIIEGSGDPIENDGSTEDRIIKDGTNSVTYTNTYITVNETGIHMNNRPFVIMIAVAFCALGLFAGIKSRKRFIG
ncbi:MAG: hypothetical protein EOM40_15325 [Clostridia bacterium]|nr:hypothetical protein [Clostridia bacterium]